MINNLLIIAGTGNKAGKTSMACRIIADYPKLEFTTIKITPHFHDITEGLLLIEEDKSYSIYEETNRNGTKDTSRMLNAGSKKVYFAKVRDDNPIIAFNKIMERVPIDTPVICESPSLRNFVEPGAFIIMTSDSFYNKKNIKHLQALPHLMIKLEDLAELTTLPVSFIEGKWHIKSKIS
jgi:hypothetical protein